MAARKAAYNCAMMAGDVIREAIAPSGIPPAVEKLLEPLRVEQGEEAGPPRDPTADGLCWAIDRLCNLLEDGWEKIPPVEEYLLLVASGPASEGGMTRSTAHRLAWDYAHH